MTPFKELFDDGKLAVINGCGYPQPNRSHFRSMEIWHTANPTKYEPTGWLGHYVDHVLRGTEGLLKAVNIGAGAAAGAGGGSRGRCRRSSRSTISASAPIRTRLRRQAGRADHPRAQRGEAIDRRRCSTSRGRRPTRSSRPTRSAESSRGYKPDVDYPGGLGQQPPAHRAAHQRELRHEALLLPDRRVRHAREPARPARAAAQQRRRVDQRVPSRT